MLERDLSPTKVATSAGRGRHATCLKRRPDERRFRTRRSAKATHARGHESVRRPAEEAGRRRSHVPRGHAAHSLRVWHGQVRREHVRRHGTAGSVTTWATSESWGREYRSALVLRLHGLLLRLLLLMRHWRHLSATHPSWRHLLQPGGRRRPLEDLCWTTVAEISLAATESDVYREARWWRRSHGALGVTALLGKICLTLSRLGKHGALPLCLLHGAHHA